MRFTRIQPEPRQAVYEQIAAELRRAIVEEGAKPGDRFPLAKDLAKELGVNVNTVLRALHLLREEGTLEFRRGRGITIAGTPERTALQARVSELVRYARDVGYRREELLAMVAASH
jgi:GntR family transcriptional regulator